MDARERYDSLFQFYGSRAGIDWRLLKAIGLVESGLRPDVASLAGAVGLMQFTHRAWADAIRWGAVPPDADRRNPEHSIAAAAAYVRWLLGQFGDVAKAIAAYNAGPARVRRIIERNPAYWESDLPTETRAYLAKVLRTQASLRSA